MNHPKNIAEKNHPLIAWAYHLHGLMLNFYEDVLETPTFCEATQIRSWQKANQLALSVFDPEPTPLPFDAKEVQLDEIMALREDLRSMEKQDPNLGIHAAQSYLLWSHLYFEHFPSKGIDQEPLLEIEMIAQQASLIAHPYCSPEECAALKLSFAHEALEQLAWGTPLRSPDEVERLIKVKAAADQLSGLSPAIVTAQIAQSQDQARDFLKNNQTQCEPLAHSERTRAIQKISELQGLLERRSLVFSMGNIRS